MDRNELPLNTRHLEVPLGVPKIISVPGVHSVHTVHPCRAEINITLNRPKELPLDHVT
jgi:hypothetical protein